MSSNSQNGGDGHRAETLHGRGAIRVLVAASSAVVRSGLEALLASSPTLHVVGTSAAGPLLAHDVADLRPDVVLAETDGDSDIDYRDAAFVLLVDGESGSDVAEALRSGARGLLPRQATAAEIVAAVEAAAAGLVVMHADLLASTLPATPPPLVRAAPHQALSAREVEVLRMLAEGMGNKAIAQRLLLSEHTVKFHLNSIFTKLNVSSRTEAVTLGVRLGLIML